MVPGTITNELNGPYRFSISTCENYTHTHTHTQTHYIASVATSAGPPRCLR